MALPIFAITLFVSAFLLFLVQPMIGKLILPKLGGTPQVWNTCMVFFQSVLLLGYAYTHWVSTKLKLRQQLMLHCGLLVIPVLLMLWRPFYETVTGWAPPSEGNPIPQTLILLASVVGIPFFVVSTSAPLLQRWFAYSGDPAAKDPYFLYGASNLGSLLSLLFYPALMEPWTALPAQSTIWLVSYVGLAALVTFCAYKIYLLAPPDSVLEAQAALAAAPAPEPTPEAPAPAPVPAPAVESATAVKAGPGPGGGRSIQRKKGMKGMAAAKPDEPKVAVQGPAPVIHSGATAEMTWFRRIRWILLAAVPSSLMLGVTSFISTDLSPFPLVWVVPLALYLLSFILVYMKVWTGKRYQIFGPSGYTLHEIVLYVVQPLGLIVLCFIILSHRFDPFWVTFAVMFGFFANALACHGELANDRPATKHLTEYFLLMSVGGMIGGVFNGIFAPIVFQRGVYEFHCAIVIACLVRPQYIPSGWFDELVLNAFPGLQNWARTQGDEMAKSMGRPAPHSTYLFSLFLDVIFGVFICSIAYWLSSTFNTGTQAGTDNLEGVMKFLHVSGAYASVVFNILVFFTPLVFCFFFAGRPLRMGLAVAGLLLGNLYFAERDDRRLLEASRTYFGILRVQEGDDYVRDPEEIAMFRQMPVKTKDGEFAPPYPFTFLMHGTTYHGRNYYRVYGKDDYEKYRIDLSRLATTYYHRYGPVGIVMERYNWSLAGIANGTKDKLPALSYPGRQNDFSADMRMPVSLIGLGAGVQQPFLAMLTQTQSEPPLATIGLGTGTMVSYARPYGHFTYYEIDEAIRHFSLPEDGSQARFTFLQNAIRRGVNLEVIMGDARQSLQFENTDRSTDPMLKLAHRKNFANTFLFQADFSKPKLGESYPYADARYNYDTQINSVTPDRDGYYRAINVDAFSSDAIPVHLVTKQAIQVYMDKLAEDGVLCVHTSNRHMDLVRPVARIAKELGLTCRVGKDLGERTYYMGHFSSEYVMIYRGDFFTKYIESLAAKKKEFIKNYMDAAKEADGLEKAQAAGTLMMRPPIPASRENPRGVRTGPAPPGWQILNSDVLWYDPFENLDEGRYRSHRAVTNADHLWTDDYTAILPLLR